MAEERDEERTEPATPRRRQEARERGQVARSGDLSTAAVLLTGALALRFAGRTLMGGLFAGTASTLEGLDRVGGDSASLTSLLMGSGTSAVVGFLPLAGILLAAGLAACLAQVGFLFTLEPLAPDFDRIDPVAGLGRLLSVRGLARLAAGFLKLAALAAVVAWTLWGERLRLLELAGDGFERIPQAAADLMMTLSLRAALALFILALFEYAFQRWQYERDLRMSKREVREELKRYEGDPQIRQRRRSIQARIALDRMILGVPQSTVVVSGAGEVAVAVRYDRTMGAPVVAAKGARRLARRIREAALDHGVPVVEREDLARALYRSGDVGHSIAPELYPGVAEILAYVYRLKGLTLAS